ncbi:hypothetical protein B0H13DRAFT_1855536 [Mycena leptocephala]|nr:hypothetical protein B0H13DRAFT_1855536 [Mycena leptocephala]
MVSDQAISLQHYFEELDHKREDHRAAKRRRNGSVSQSPTSETCRQYAGALNSQMGENKYIDNLLYDRELDSDCPKAEPRVDDKDIDLMHLRCNDSEAERDAAWEELDKVRAERDEGIQQWDTISSVSEPPKFKLHGSQSERISTALELLRDARLSPNALLLEALQNQQQHNHLAIITMLPCSSPAKLCVRYSTRCSRKKEVKVLHNGKL